jgi:hypothetical protein
VNSAVERSAAKIGTIDFHVRGGSMIAEGVIDHAFADWFENCITPYNVAEGEVEDGEVVEFSPKNTIAREDALFIWRAAWAACAANDDIIRNNDAFCVKDEHGKLVETPLFHNRKDAEAYIVHELNANPKYKVVGLNLVYHPK